ncbi:hypothetical protein DFH09DRAFT_1088943 [Mycena vulgaris]|nr:hypothetical protein DFH09DRAFT_1088943 [Mycena vulgaris]
MQGIAPFSPPILLLPLLTRDAPPHLPRHLPRLPSSNAAVGPIAERWRRVVGVGEELPGEGWGARMVLVSMAAASVDMGWDGVDREGRDEELDGRIHGCAIVHLRAHSPVAVAGVNGFVGRTPLVDVDAAEPFLPDVSSIQNSGATPTPAFPYPPRTTYVIVHPIVCHHLPVSVNGSLSAMAVLLWCIALSQSVNETHPQRAARKGATRPAVTDVAPARGEHGGGRRYFHSRLHCGSPPNVDSTSSACTSSPHTFPALSLYSLVPRYSGPCSSPSQSTFQMGMISTPPRRSLALDWEIDERADDGRKMGVGLGLLWRRKNRVWCTGTGTRIPGVQPQVTLTQFESEAQYDSVDTLNSSVKYSEAVLSAVRLSATHTSYVLILTAFGSDLYGSEPGDESMVRDDNIGPLDADRLVATPEGLIMPQNIVIPTFQSVRRMRQGGALALRREACIEKGMAGLSRPSLRGLGPASRRMQDIVFKVEFQALEALFTRVSRGEMHFHDASGISFSTLNVYRFDSARFQVLMAQLDSPPHFSVLERISAPVGNSNASASGNTSVTSRTVQGPGHSNFRSTPHFSTIEPQERAAGTNDILETRRSFATNMYGPNLHRAPSYIWNASQAGVPAGTRRMSEVFSSVADQFDGQQANNNVNFGHGNRPTETHQLHRAAGLQGLQPQVYTGRIDPVNIPMSSQYGPYEEPAPAYNASGEFPRGSSANPFRPMPTSNSAGNLGPHHTARQTGYISHNEAYGPDFGYQNVNPSKCWSS